MPVWFPSTESLRRPGLGRLVVLALLLVAIAAIGELAARPATAQSGNEVVSLISSDCAGAPTCYASLGAWEADFGGIDFGGCAEGDLVCAGISAVALIDGSWSSVDRSKAKIEGWQTGPSNYIRIATTLSSRHAGRFRNDLYRRWKVINITESYVRIEGLQFHINLANISNAVYVNHGVQNGASDVRISHSIFRAFNTSGKTRRGVGARRGNVRVWNNFFYGWAGARAFAVVTEGTGTVLHAYNNTVVDCGTGFLRRRGAMVVKNNLVQACDDGFNVATDPQSDHNISDLEGDAPGPNSVSGVAVQFRDPGAGDYRLALTDVTAWNAGMNLSADGFNPFADDIEGEVRVDPWDVGADEVADGPLTVTNLLVGAVTEESATITWSTSAPASSRVEYGPSSGYGSTTPIDTTPVTQHSAIVSGLSPATLYHLRAISVDGEGTEAASGDQVFTTLAELDTTPPTIGSVSASPEQTSATITWQTNEASTTQVLYGLTSSYDSSSTLDPTLATAHAAGLTDLTAGTLYHYVVGSVDASGNEALSADLTFTTAAAADTTPPAAVQDLTVTACTQTSCDVTWTAPGDDGTTGTPDTYDLRYASAPIDAISWDAAMQVTGEPTPSLAGAVEGFTVTGLTASTIYYFAIQSADEVPNTSVLSNVPSLTTAASPPSSGFNFLVYGDSRSDSCGDNAAHATLVGAMAAEPADLALHAGNMITGWTDTTNWTQNGSCSNGSFVDLATPLLAKAAVAGLPAFLFPTLGNHDENWGSDWYPDAFGAGLIQGLVPNHTRGAYFQDQSGGAYPIYTDAEFASLQCSTSSDAAYPAMFYYSFDHENSHFVVLMLNDSSHDLETCSSCTDTADYDDDENIHQLHWLQSDLQAANATPGIDNIFVFVHAPVFSSGSEHATNPSWQRLAREFSAARVNAVFSAHNHVYERTVPIRTDNANPSGVQDDVNGTTFITSGGGGMPPGSFGPAQWYDATRLLTQHYVRVNVAGTTVTIQAVDINGDVIDDFTLPVPGPGDATPPTISAVSAAPGETDAAVSWQTDEPATSQVLYGLTTAYGSATVDDTALTTSHEVTLEGLTAATLYHYVVRSVDAAGNETISGDTTFTTSDGTLTVSDLLVATVTEDSATIAWSTNAPASSRVEYGLDSGYGSTTPLDTTPVAEHSIVISGLSPATLYHLRAISVDGEGTEAASDDRTFTTLDEDDTTPPAISAVSASPGQTGATITWQTDEASTTQVLYGLTGSHGSSSALDATLVTLHGASLTGLSAGTLYHYAVSSLDASGNQTVSASITFTTLEEDDTTPPAIDLTPRLVPRLISVTRC